jgi:hypothetical protein
MRTPGLLPVFVLPFVPCAIGCSSSGAAETGGSSSLEGGAPGGPDSAGTGEDSGAESAAASDAADAASMAAPDFGPNVFVFDPSMPMATIQNRLDSVFAQQAQSQFGAGRYAFLFKAGQYNLDVRVGYYTQVLGLGASPDDVTIVGAVRSNAALAGGNATLNFWRSAENLAVKPAGGSSGSSTNVWAVSQGADLRRVHVEGSLSLSDGGNSSGGFMADSKVDGTVTSGSQQQWFSRNTEWGGWTGGVWNMVFVGTALPPVGTWPVSPYTVVDKTPVIQEKPYLTFDPATGYAVVVPGARTNSQGTSWSAGAPSTARSLPISLFYVAHPDVDTAASMTAALNRGQHLLLTPGVYHLEQPIQVVQPDAIVLGLGLPTLVPDTAAPAMILGDVDGIRVGGLILDAGTSDSGTLLQVGDPASSADHSLDPISLYDVFCRVGGATAGTVSTCVTIHSSQVVGDNLWLWRADHGAGVGWTQNRAKNGLVVGGSAVTMYGLAVEHFQETQTMWNGDSGRVYFYQSEMPYDVPSQASWQNAGANGFASYAVGSAVANHEASGLGVYCAFRSPVVADDAVEAPAVPGVSIHHVVTVWLAGAAGSAITHVMNGAGGAASQGTRLATIN